MKLPAWLAKFTGKNLNFRFSSGGSFPLEDSPRPKLVIHCGGCMLTRRELLHRIELAKKAKVPIVNYGIVLSAAAGLTNVDENGIISA